MASYLGWQGDKSINRLNLPDSWVKRCSDMPESGMGYQKVDVIVDDGKENKPERVISGIVLNCSVLETVESVDPSKILDISLS